MTNAILLAAGQGKRLAPLTNDKPKCMLSIAGHRLIEWQLYALASAGIEDVTVVTGFEADSVEAALKLTAPPLRVRARYNPFYAMADNIASCWVVRDLIGDDTVLINGDTLFDPRILTTVLRMASDPITVTVDRKQTYDADDMKIQMTNGRVARIGKSLSGPIDGESIGMLRFSENGGALFAGALERTLRDPAALHLWYLSVIDALAADGVVGALSIEGLSWAEIDFPHDLPIAAARVADFDWTMPAGSERPHPALSGSGLAQVHAMGPTI